MMIRDCIKAASLAFCVPVADILRRDRSHRASHPRFAAMKIASDAGFPARRIGRIMKRDHTTVLHGRRRAVEVARADEDFALKLKAALFDVGLWRGGS